MGKNQAATQSTMENLLASIQHAIGPSEAGATQEPVLVAELESAPQTRANSVPAQAAVPVSQTEEISNLRKRIAGNLNRDGQVNGFATILGSRPPASLPMEPALLENRLLERALPPTAPHAFLRQSVSDSGSSDFAETPSQPVQPEPPSWRTGFRPVPPPQRSTAYEERGMPRNQALMSDEASAAANAAFSRLAENLMSRAIGDRSIEDLTRELLRIMLKQWLDDNLPDLVERIVRDEIERVARRGSRSDRR